MKELEDTSEKAEKAMEKQRQNPRGSQIHATSHDVDGDEIAIVTEHDDSPNSVGASTMYKLEDGETVEDAIVERLR